MINLKHICIVLILLPLINALLIGLIGKYIKPIIVSSISIIFVAITALITVYFLWHFYVIKDLNNINYTWYIWGKYANIEFTFGFLLDQLNIIMLSMVAIISLIVHVYSAVYMWQDPGYNRYFSYISFFTATMYLLIIANNFLQLFVGWELVGLASYLLIGFWFKQESANKAALKAILINRVGDIGLLVAIAIIFGICGDLNYIKVFTLLPKNTEFSELVNIISITFFIAIITKSAQIPLHTWLADSMEAPTPVSALIHAATMVVAGIFLIARMSPIFEHSEYCLNLMLFLGSTTALLMGIIAMVETDIKRILAYSTISQLGIMMVAMGASAYSAGIFHLLVHSFYKALLFLGAGVIIIVTNNIQNINDMPKLKQYLPITYWCMLIASLSATGIPGFSSFFSKHLIVETVRLSNLPFATIAYYLLNFTMWITAIYTFRMFLVIFHQESHEHNKVLFTTTTKQSATINTCLIILTMFSLLLGYMLIKPILNNNLFGNSILVLPQHNIMQDYIEQNFKNILFILWQGITSIEGVATVLGLLCAFLFYLRKPHLPKIIKQIIQVDFTFFYNFLQNKYFFNELNQFVVVVAKFCAKFFSEIIDLLLIDRLLINGLVKSIVIGSKNIQKLQTGHLSHYLFLMLTGALIILLWLFINIY